MAPSAARERANDALENAKRLVLDVRRHLRDWEREGRYPRQAVVASGLKGLFSPADVGGLDLTFPQGMDAFEELGRGDAALAFSISMHNAVAAAVTRKGDPTLRGAWGRRLAAGDALGGFSLTEPQAGSDATAITTFATQTGSGWRVSGRKAWVTLAGEADLFLVACKTSNEPGHRDIAMLAVERASPGVSFPTLYEKAGAPFLPIGEMVLEDVPARLLSPPGQGFRDALLAIDVGRTDIAAIANGLHAEALDIALRYGRDRMAFGQRVLDFQGIQWALADAATDLAAGRLLTRKAAELLGTAEGSVAVAHAKRFGPDAALRAAVACSEVLGAYGWLREFPLARFIDYAKMLQVVDGTAEIQRIVIARDLAKRADGL